MCLVCFQQETLMDTNASNFSTRGNAKRSAEQMIARGTAPAADYGVERRDDGRFQLLWKTAPVIVEAAEADEAQASEPNERHVFRNAEKATRSGPDRNAGKAETKAARTDTSHNLIPQNGPTSLTPGFSEPAPISPHSEAENQWPDGTHVMVRTHRSWRKAKIITRLGPLYWRAEYSAGGSGMFREADIRAYDVERDAAPASEPDRAKAAAPKKAARSKYGIDLEAIATGRLPEKPPVVTSAANPHYQKHFDRLFDLAKAGKWGSVREYKVSGTNSYSKKVARYRDDLLALHAASETAQ
jgi:hypothetical protein